MALLSTEAEYRGAAIANCEATWLRRLLQDLRIEVPTLIPMYYDNMSNMQLAKNPMFHARMKHIEVHYHFMHEQVLNGEVELWYVWTDQQVSDEGHRDRQVATFLKYAWSSVSRHATLEGRTGTGTGRIGTETGKVGNGTGQAAGEKETTKARGNKKKKEVN